jgi:mevalonate kinase
MKPVLRLRSAIRNLKPETLNKHFYSNGKLLLTAEYLVLDGAEALAIPTVYGQSLEVRPGTENVLKWKSLDEDYQVWFEAAFQINGSFSVISFSDKKMAETLQHILAEAKKLNPDFLSIKNGVEVISHLNFPRNWGLGSSSTLINNIAQWANVDAFVLLKNSFGGSGYDIACAQNDVPVLYSNKQTPPTVKKVDLNWNFTEELFFVYLNKKQDSKKSISHYNQLGLEKHTFIEQVNLITREILKAKTIAHFEVLIEQHESLLSEMLQLPKIKDQLFSDFRGSLKSLGGWGGDFILATGKDVPDYFRKKGFTVIVPFKKMIK